MNDKQYCSGEGCPQKNNCWRYVQSLSTPANEMWMGKPEWDGKRCKLYKGN